MDPDEGAVQQAAFSVVVGGAFYGGGRRAAVEPRKAVRAQLGRGRQERVGRWALGTLGAQEPAWGSWAPAAADGNPGDRRMVRGSSSWFRPGQL